MIDKLLVVAMVVLGFLFPCLVYGGYRIWTAESKGDVDDLPGCYD